MTQTKLFYSLLAACNFTFLVYFLLLGYYNQPALDDYCVISAQSYYGFNSPITFWYQFWNGRYLPLYFCNLFLSLFVKTDTTIWFTLFLMVGFIFSIYRILSILSKKYLVDKPTNNWHLFNISAFIFNILVYNNFKFNTFFWLNASTMYFGGILFFLIGIGEILANQKKWYSNALIVFSFLYAGCSTENHALVMVMIMVGLIGIKYLFPKKIKINLSPNYYLGTVSLFISFLLLIMAPGSQQRIVSDSAHVTNNGKLTLIIDFFQNFTLKYFQLIGEIILLYLPFVLLVIPIFLSIFNAQISQKIADSNSKKIQIGPFILALIALIGAAIAPTIYIFGNLGPQRILTIVNVLLLAFTLIICLKVFIKNYKQLNFKLVHQIAIVAILMITAQVGMRIFTETPKLQKYSSFEIEKRKNLNEFGGKEDFVYQNPEELNTPNISEKIIVYLLEPKYSDQLTPFRKILKHEPILPNIIDEFDIKIYEDCYHGAYRKVVKIRK